MMPVAVMTWMASAGLLLADAPAHLLLASASAAGYFMAISPDKIPRIEIPLHTLIEMVPMPGVGRKCGHLNCILVIMDAGMATAWGELRSPVLTRPAGAPCVCRRHHDSAALPPRCTR